MTKQPDNLFRNKLENFQMSPPANAWSKIESGLDTSSKKGLWLKIAAGIVLFAVAGILLWTTSSDDATLLAFESSTIQIESMEQRPDGDVPEVIPNNTAIAIHEEQTGTVKKNKPTIEKRNPVQQNKNLLAQATAPIEDTDGSAEILITETHAEVLADVSSVDTEVLSQESLASVYLVYTADEVNEKYLRKPSNVDATSDEKKSSRIQMLMSVANNLKNGDGGLTDLRQMKDEIFALNFLDDKKQQSKKN